MKLFLILFFVSFSFSNGFPKEYYEIKDTKKMKQEFFKTLSPLVDDANKEILEDRKKLFEAIKTLKALAKKYNLKDYDDINSMLYRIDTIPKKLALAQAALESGWGKSRFVKEGNNIFGHWTFGKKGLLPSKRDEGKKHKIRIFNSLEDSIKAYMKNLNTHGAYKLFRKKRKEFKDQNKTFTALDAAPTMKDYSQLKEEYVRRLKIVIKQINLDNNETKILDKNITEGNKTK